MRATATLQKDGRLVIPKKLRDALKITPGTRLTLKQEGGLLYLTPGNPSPKAD